MTVGHFYPLIPLPSSPQLRTGLRSCSALSLILLKKRDKPNKEDKVFLLVELRRAIQKYS
jgi:hypothetical protein